MDDKMLELIHSMDKKLDVLVFQFDDIKKDTESLNSCINGNGKEGLKDKVNRMETENKTEIKTIKWLGGIISFTLGIIAYFNK